MNFIARNINMIGILLLTGFAAAAGALYWGVPQPIKQVRAASPAAAVAKYVCPMHANVTSDKPDDCSICGMKLVAAKQETSESATPVTASGCAREMDSGCCGSKAGTNAHAGCSHGEQAAPAAVAEQPNQ